MEIILQRKKKDVVRNINFFFKKNLFYILDYNYSNYYH